MGDFMLTKLVMVAIIVFLGCLVLLRDTKGKTSHFFDLQNSNCMRGFWCLIILLVHVPQEYQNTLQDALGSFAYIGVSFFFMTSGYGLMLGVLKEPDSIKQFFWKKRLTKLLIPLVFVNIVTVLAELAIFKTFNWKQFISITAFVRQILLFYLLFWLVFRILPKKMTINLKTAVLCFLVVIMSVVIYLLKGRIWFAWPVESMGFLYGVLLAKHKGLVEKTTVSKGFVKIAILCVVSLVFGVLYLKFKHTVFVGDYLLKLLLGASLLAFMLLLNTKFSIGNAISRFLGKISYEVYLIHNVVFVILAALPIEFNSGIFIILSMALTVALSYVVNIATNKTLKLFNKSN